jgi:hypothetical protein
MADNKKPAEAGFSILAADRTSRHEQADRIPGELQSYYVSSSRAFLALLDGELNALTFVQGLEARGLDGGEVNEHVFAAVGWEMKQNLSRR